MRRKPHSLPYKKGKVTTILTNTGTENIKFLLLIRIYTGLCYFELVEDRSQEDTRNLERYWSLLKEVCEYLKNDNSNLAKIILNIVVS